MWDPNRNSKTPFRIGSAVAVVAVAVVAVTAVFVPSETPGPISTWVGMFWPLRRRISFTSLGALGYSLWSLQKLVA